MKVKINKPKEAKKTEDKPPRFHAVLGVSLKGESVEERTFDSFQHALDYAQKKRLVLQDGFELVKVKNLSEVQENLLRMEKIAELRRTRDELQDKLKKVRADLKALGLTR